ncbi:TrmH family RNA methyltransferase [Thermohalobacter berrensis]|uniref:23S rRNA (Guanosine(2251)-2'-O)-methyltransferase RlmB n=1 Tax=Thermohalobacter berrensis TaxID=99594 RepID=A0A419T507_9FIRM|nr:RNA methyltransferase [Thermohalobacter berrensis]RKD32532.1 23S rRNA (guanosine(2251)-2'-O)-methyltransferase RlmB [Thermohalobacter berrensis]
MIKRITSPSNPLIKYVKSLHRKKKRWEHKSYIIEGVRLVEDCLNSNAEIEYILYSDSLLNVKDGDSILEKLKSKGYTLYNITDNILKKISDTMNPQGIIAVVKINSIVLEDILTTNNILILLDRIQDPGNMGTIIRTAEALGATGILVTEGCVDIYNPKVVRATMGSIFRVPIVFLDDTKEKIKYLKSKGIQIIATSLDTNKFCHEVDFKNDFILVVGNEASGVSDEILRASTEIIKIPMVGKAESLNAAMAFGITMYEARRQRMEI